MFRKVISQALLLVLLGWAVPPSVLRADSAMGHAMSHAQHAEGLQPMRNHACCPHIYADTAPAPVNLAVPFTNEHRLTHVFKPFNVFHRRTLS